MNIPLKLCFSAMFVPRDPPDLMPDRLLAARKRSLVPFHSGVRKSTEVVLGQTCGVSVWRNGWSLLVSDISRFLNDIHPHPGGKGAGQICDPCCHVVIECKWGRAKVARDYMTWPVCKFQKILQFWNCVDRGSKFLTVELTCSKWITEWIFQYVIVIRSNQIMPSSCQRSATWDSRISREFDPPECSRFVRAEAAQFECPEVGNAVTHKACLYIGVSSLMKWPPPCTQSSKIVIGNAGPVM